MLHDTSRLSDLASRSCPSSSPRVGERLLASEASARELDAPSAWRALCDGRLSVVEVFAHDGRSYLVARSSMPGRPLSPREAEVVALAARGHANKLIAFELGVATSTVAQLLSRAMHKLGVRNRVELIRWAKAARR